MPEQKSALRSPQERWTERRLWLVHGAGVLRDIPVATLDPERPDLRLLPYGAVVLPTTDMDGNAVVIVKQPGQESRPDVLLIEHPSSVTIRSTGMEERRDVRPGRPEHTRLRVRMACLAKDCGDQPASVAVLRIATKTKGRRPLGDTVRARLATLGYTIRPGDQVGWFEYGEDAFPDPPFRHGYPDIATREQGAAGIRGPSRLAIGLQHGIRMRYFRPRRPRPLAPGERVIYELHVGTFTTEGTFAAAAQSLHAVRKIGVTTLQLMPVDIGSGPPGWTYDQTRTGAVERKHYGGSEGLIAFVERAHRLGLEVIVDKQYNHAGPEQDSRGHLIPDMFTRHTPWGAGLAGRENPHYPQVVKLLGEEMAYWVTHFGIDGFRFDASNRLPPELHEWLATCGHGLAAAVGKPLYLLSEYAECEAPQGIRVPTGHQYADQTGRYLMQLLGLSKAAHVMALPSDGGSTLRAMLKAARRGWWYPHIPVCAGGLRGSERSTTLLWHHDWIGNRFGGERISHLVSFAMYKTLAVWQGLGQWTPFLFMGTERYARTPWYFFTGHHDPATKNGTSAHYHEDNDTPLLKGGRFLEFQREAEEAGLREALRYSQDGTVAGIDWEAFRSQTDKSGQPYMDHAKQATFAASQLNWADDSDERYSIERLFAMVLRARRDRRLQEDDPRATQYKAWEANERRFVLRRRASDGTEFVALFNLGGEPALFRIAARGIEACGSGAGYIVALDEGRREAGWAGGGRYRLWLSTEARTFGGAKEDAQITFAIPAVQDKDIAVASESVMVFSKVPPR
jgi:1,4-alpha-glucan branching enzyme